MKNFVMMCGLPRTGSTLLSSILNQNPLIHAEGNSAVCQLMWDMEVSCNTSGQEQIKANKREKTVFDLVSSIPKIYYKDVDRPIIVDKCRTWNNPANIDIVNRYIDCDPKFIVLIRPVNEIVISFLDLFDKNNVKSKAEYFINKDSEILKLLHNVQWASQNNQNKNFIFVKYQDLVYNTTSTLNKIYEFCGWDNYTHDLQNIINEHPEDDSVYRLDGMHDVRSTLNKRKSKAKLSKENIDLCLKLDETFYKDC